MLPGKKYTPEEIVRIVIRRWWLILLPLVVGSAAGVLAYFVMPVQYRSETVIMVVPQRLTGDMVRSTVTSSVAERLSSITQQILSRSRLEMIISEAGLYEEERSLGIMEDVVQRMRDDIDVSLEGEARDLVRLSYKSADSATAQRVTARLASVAIDENLRLRTALAAGTTEFLEGELKEAKRRLLEQEKKLEEYRRRHAGQLPSQVASNLQSMQSAQMQLQAVGESVNRARERRLLIERQLIDAQTLPTAVAVPGVAAMPDGASQLTAAQQLEGARARLEALKLRYTADHPDIKAVQRTLRDLEARAQEEEQRPPSPDGKLGIAEAARQKRIGDLEADLAVIDRQIATGEADDLRLRRSIADFQAKIDVLPTRESELVELMRDYSSLQEQYGNLLTKREQARIGENVERMQIGEQFRIVDPASLPERPFNERQRLGALAGGILGGLAVGLFFVGFLEYRDSSFKSEEDVLRVLTLPVLALVPLMTSASEGLEHQRRSRTVLGGVVAIVVVLGTAAALAFWTLQP